MRVNRDLRAIEIPSVLKLVASETGFGGGERIFLDLAKALIELDVNVVIVTPEESKLRKALSDDGILTAQSIDAKVKATVMLANDFKSLLKSGLSFGMKRGLICHGPWELTWKKKAYLKFFRVDLFCVSNYVAGFTQSGMRIRRSKVCILNYGPALKKEPDLDSAKVLAREKFGLRTDAKIIGSLSRYHSVKRIDELIEIFRGREEILLLGLSTGFNTQDEIVTKNLIGRIELPPNVKIFENIETSIFFDAIDVLISLSSAETLGLTFLEASARGIPTFTTAKGGPNDFLIHGLNGFFLRNESMQENGKEFFKKIQDNNLLERLVRNSKAINSHRNPKISANQIIGTLL